jgi:hypothetical protein
MKFVNATTSYVSSALIYYKTLNIFQTLIGPFASQIMDITLTKIGNLVLVHIYRCRASGNSMAAAISFGTNILTCFLSNGTNSPNIRSIYQTIYVISNNVTVQGLFQAIVATGIMTVYSFKIWIISQVRHLVRVQSLWCLLDKLNLVDNLYIFLQ